MQFRAALRVGDGGAGQVGVAADERHDGLDTKCSSYFATHCDGLQPAESFCLRMCVVVIMS